MRYPLKIQQLLARQEQMARIHRTTALFNIYHLLDREPSQLSGGDQQCVALGWASFHWPGAFLMDEPLSNLDARLRTYIYMHGNQGAVA